MISFSLKERWKVNCSYTPCITFDCTRSLISHSPAGQGSVSLRELLTIGDLFERTPALTRLPEHESNYRVLGQPESISLGFIRRADGDWKALSPTGEEHGCNLLKLFDGFPVLRADYEYLSKRLMNLSKRTSISDNQRWEPYSINQITSNRPFRNYLNKVLIQTRPEIFLDVGKKVISVYQNLLRGSKNVPGLYVKLRKALATAPDLLQEFRLFVPTRLHTKWASVEESVIAQEQINSFKRHVKLRYRELLQEGGQNLPGIHYSEHVRQPKSAEELQADMELLATAVLFPVSNILKKEARRQIDDLRNLIQLNSLAFAGILPELQKSQTHIPLKVAKILAEQGEFWAGIRTYLDVRDFDVVEGLQALCRVEIRRASAPAVIPEPIWEASITPRAESWAPPSADIWKE